MCDPYQALDDHLYPLGICYPVVIYSFSQILILD